MQMHDADDAILNKIKQYITKTQKKIIIINKLHTQDIYIKRIAVDENEYYIILYKSFTSV